MFGNLPHSCHCAHCYVKLECQCKPSTPIKTDGYCERCDPMTMSRYDRRHYQGCDCNGCKAARETGK